MIKNIINKLNEKYINSTTEEAYINKIIYIEKQYWKSNMTQKVIYKETAKFINKLKLYPEKHSFLIAFRNDMNELFQDSEVNDDKLDELFSSLFKYKNELSKKKLS